MKICPACNARFDSNGWVCPICGYTPPETNGFPALAAELANSSEGFHPEYFEQLASLEAGNFWFQSCNTLILLLLKKHIPIGIASAFPSAALAGA